MRNIKIAPGEYYHIYNRGVNKQKIFHDRSDWARFLFLILYFQSPLKVSHLGRVVKDLIHNLGLIGQHSVLTNLRDEVVKKRMVELIAFCLMPNHFHLIIKEVEEGGIASYMQRVLNAYAKYYNTKYEKSGHLFQGPYGAVHVENDNQLIYLSAYIHRNPRELSDWYNKEESFPWSSYQDFIGENRYGDLLLPDIVLVQSRNKKKYHEFVKASRAKTFDDELPYLEDL